MTAHPLVAPGHAIDQYIKMTELAEKVGDIRFEKYGGACVGDMKHDEESGLHYIPVSGLLDNEIEMSRTHVWEDGRIEDIFGL